MRLLAAVNLCGKCRSAKKGHRRGRGEGMAQTLNDIMAPFPGRWAAGTLLPDPNSQIVRVLTLWQKAMGERTFPPSSALGPLELKPVLPDVHIYDIARQPPRYRVRLIGTRMTDHIGRNLAGKPVDEIPLETLRRVIEGLLHALETGRTFMHLMAPRAVALPNGDHKALESLWLPCAEDGETIDRVIAVSLLSDA